MARQFVVVVVVGVVVVVVVEGIKTKCLQNWPMESGSGGTPFIEPSDTQTGLKGIHTTTLHFKV